MKRLIFCLTCFCFFLFNACDNEIDSNCIEVKLVAEVCGNAVLQVQDGRFNNELGTYTDIDGKIHENVFGTFLMPCNDSYPEKIGDSFFITLADSSDYGNCVVCLALLANMPEQRYDVRIVEPCVDRTPEL